jgi:hypothetical protein
VVGVLQLILILNKGFIDSQSQFVIDSQ